MEEEKGNFSRHIGQIAQANGQLSVYCVKTLGLGVG